MRKRKRPIFGNKKIYHPDGFLMFRCGDDKLDWYVSRGLAKKVGDDAQLLFAPKGMGYFQDEYLLADKSNICVVCGHSEELELTRHHVVPYCYRVHFPLVYKEHNHYDVLPLCRKCHDIYEHSYAFQLKEELAGRYDAPLNGVFDVINLDYNRAVARAFVIQKQGDKLPANRKQLMLDFITKYLGRIPTNDDLHLLAKKPKLNICDIKITHGKLVVSKIENLDEFVRMWRNHFITTMNPKYLPAGWTISGKVKRK